MRIGLKDIDKEIVAKIEDRLLAPLKEFLKEDIHWKGLPFRLHWKWDQGGPALKRKREPNQDELGSYELRKKREETYAYRMATAIMLPMLLSFVTTATLSQTGATPLIDLGGGLGVLAGSAVLGAWWTKKASAKRRLEDALSLEEMRAVFPLLTLNRAERIYCDALLMLRRIDEKEDTETNFREMLKQLNELLLSYRQLESRRQSLLPILGMLSIAELEQEYGELGQRLDSTQDGVTRNAIQQSLEMCGTRLESAKQIKQNMERLQTQQEAVLQTLASGMSAIARLQVAPSIQVQETAQELTQSVARMHQQNYAVEQAVEEVLTLRLD